MSKAKFKGAALYQKLRAQRKRLVIKYEAGGTIRYDEAVGMRDIGGERHVTLRSAEFRSHPDNLGIFPELARTSLQKPDIAGIRARNEAEFGAGTTMLEALKKRASGKVVQLFGDDDAFNFGGLIIGDTECLIRVMEDLTSEIFVGSFPAYSSPRAAANPAISGLVHALGADSTGTLDTPHESAVEKESIGTRGSFKQGNYRLPPSVLKAQDTIWGYQDKSRLSVMLLGHNSMIRMWGENQVLDLNGKRLSMHERPNRVAGFSVLVDLSDGHFAGLTTHSAKNVHIYSSQPGGMLARNNHFAVRGHFVENLLIEDVISGDAETLNHGSYFGTCILNKSSNVVVKNLQQKQINEAVSNSSLGLSWYAQLAFTEMLFGYYEPAENWDAVAVPADPTRGILADILTRDLYPWMKWEAIAPDDIDTYGNGKKTAYPTIKEVAEIAALGIGPDEAALVRSELEAADAAYVKSTKLADDMEVATNIGHNAFNQTRDGRKGLPVDALQRMTDVKQIPRSTNAIIHNPLTSNLKRYPDSVSYGFRVGSADIGVGRLADVEVIDDTGKPRSARAASMISVCDSSFERNNSANVEALTFGGRDGLQSAFGGMGLRPFGYSNMKRPVPALAPASMLFDKATLIEKVPATATEQMPVDSLDLCQAAIDADAEAKGEASLYTREKAFGLYKGNDVLEPALATITAIEHLKAIVAAKPQLAAAGFALNGLGHSVETPVLAWRKSMMDALGAKTACHVGLKGGYEGSIFQDGLVEGQTDNYNYAEIYPWFVSKDGYTNQDGYTDIDKDVVFTEQANAKLDRRLTQPYLATTLPPVDTAMRWDLVDQDTMRLLKADGSPATYGDCATLLGFGDVNDAAAAEVTICRNVDGQNHTAKGIFGVRIDEVDYANVQNVSVKTHETFEAAKPIKTLGSDTAQLAFGLNDDAELESDVTKIRGVSINSCEYVDIEDVSIETFKSADRAVGVEVRGFSEDVKIAGLAIDDVDASESSYGLRVSKDSKKVEISGVSGDRVTAKQEDGISSEGKCSVVQIEAQDTKMS